MDFLDQFSKLIQIILVDLVLAGDNAIVIGLVAAKFTKDYRRKIILYGVGAAVCSQNPVCAYYGSTAPDNRAFTGRRSAAFMDLLEALAGPEKTLPAQEEHIDVRGR